MKKKLYSSLVLLTIAILIINIFIKSSSLTEIITFSCNLFIKNIFPSLFPMFIISSVLVELGIPNILGSFFQGITSKLFKTKGSASFVFFMSMITGFPSSAKYISDLLDKRIINEQDAEKILMFTFFSNPLFILNTVGNIFYKSTKIGIILLTAHITGNIIIGLIFRNYNKQKYIIKENKKIDELKKLNNKINSENIFKIFFKSINSSLEILTSIFGIVTFFLILINLIFKNPHNLYQVLITGILEMTTGLKYLSIMNINLKIKLVISSFFLSFGGLSVHSQIMNILEKKKVKYLPFLIARIMHGIISSTIMYIIL